MGMEFEMDEDYTYAIPAFSPFHWDIQPLVVCINQIVTNGLSHHFHLDFEGH